MKNLLSLSLMICCVINIFAADLSPDQPVRGKWNFRSQRIWRCDEAAGIPFGDIQRILIPDGKHVVIQERRHYRIYVFRAHDGKLLQAFGKRGEGPGEIRRMQGVMAHPDGLVVPERGRLHFFSLEGKFLRSQVIPAEIEPRFFIDRDRFVSAPSLPRDEGRGDQAIEVFSLLSGESRRVTTYKAFAPGLASSNSGGRVMTVGIVIGGLTPLMQVHYRDGVLYFGKNDIYRINGVDLDGNAKVTFGITGRQKAPVSMGFKRSLFKDLEGDIPPQMLERILKGLPAECTAWTRMTSDSFGRIFVLGADLERSHAVGVDLFSPGGEYLYHGDFSVSPGESIQGMDLRENLLVMAVQDREGDLRVEAFTISTPPENR